MALPLGSDAAGADEDVGAGSGAEVEHGLALVEVGDGGRDPAAQRRAERGVGGALGLRVLVEGRAEPPGLIGSASAVDAVAVRAAAA